MTQNGPLWKGPAEQKVCKFSHRKFKETYNGKFSRYNIVPLVSVYGNFTHKQTCTANFTLRTPSQVWWCTPAISVLGRLRQRDLCKGKASLGYRQIKSLMLLGGGCEADIDIEFLSSQQPWLPGLGLHRTSLVNNDEQEGLALPSLLNQD